MNQGGYQRYLSLGRGRGGKWVMAVSDVVGWKFVTAIHKNKDTFIDSCWLQGCVIGTNKEMFKNLDLQTARKGEEQVRGEEGGWVFRK